MLRIANPPKAPPNAEPRLTAADFSDIMEPRYVGICSSVKLAADVATMPENQLPKNCKTMNTHRLIEYALIMVNIPANRAVATVICFLPNLFTSDPETILPIV